MRVRIVAVLAILAVIALSVARIVAAPANAAGEYYQHLDTLGQLTVAVAEAMPQGEYAFKPDPPSMSFGEQFVHVASTNFDFCAGLKDSDPPPKPSPTDKAGIVKFLSDSFAYCSEVVPTLTEAKLNEYHNSPDGRMPGRQILLAFYMHVAHHRGQTEIYLRDKGIAPPQYRF